MNVIKGGRKKERTEGDNGFITKCTVLIIINCHGKYCNKHVR